MNTVLDESKVERGAEVRAESAATCCGHDVQKIGKRIEEAVNDAQAAVSATLDDGRIAAERLLKRGRYAVEDGIGETAHMIKRHPVSSFAIAFAAGAALGLLAPRFGKK
jgi:ElaB/YqjD/DUF883 family membrane-anchored ribosome-binding protein